jgi:Transmembrane family 220, helix
MNKAINLVLAVLFTLFAAFQYNDTDPWRWALMYGYVAGVCGFAAFGKMNRYAIWAGIAACITWLAFWLPDFIGWVKMGSPDIAGQMRAETPYIEFAREFFGLLICLLALSWQLWRLGKSKQP